MKTLLVMLLWMGILLNQGLAQSEEAALAKDSEPVIVRATADSVAFQAKMVQRLFGVEMDYEGALTKAWRAQNALQLLNPLAPEEYGDGFDNVTTDPQTGRANGIKVFGIRF